MTSMALPNILSTASHHLLPSYSKIDGNGTVSWGPDALLTDKGKAQAANVSVAWKAQAKLGVPLPQSFYSSPLSRSMDTLNITWADWRLKERGIPQPVVLEGLRETIVRSPPLCVLLEG